MLDIILDTSVLAATLLSPTGSNTRALRRILIRPDEMHICYSSIIMAEYFDVLSRPFITGRGLQNEALALLEIIKEVGEEIVPKPAYALVYPDRTDRPFLESAVYVGGLLLTNSLKDFPFIGIAVMAPDEFLEWLDSKVT